MRIISGKLKGKKISFLKSLSTRPLKDSVKENIFNIIAHSNLININLKNSDVLDLYSGIGSFGLECISRDAKNVTFVEKDAQATQILDKNLTELQINTSAEVNVGEISKYLMRIKKKFDIFFLDPPFSEKNYIKELSLIKKKSLYKKEHIVIIHREKKSFDDFKNVLKPLITKQYGRSKIIFGKFL
jgi:16S rRNA (guanine966-N2)-methyltransferase